MILDEKMAKELLNNGRNHVVIPDFVTEIGENVFHCCFELTSITVDKHNPRYDSRGECNAIIETATNTLIKGCSSTIIPDTVTTIGNNAFENCEMTSVVIPNSVTKIEDYAFCCCQDLISITIPDSVTQFGECAFHGCPKISEESKKRLEELGYDFDRG